MTVKACNSAYESWWYSDAARYEYMTSDVFWSFAFLIIANFWWSAKQLDSFPDDENKSKEQPTASPKQSGFWLKDRLTSRLRQYLALLVTSSVIPLQLLHGSWVLKSAWRITFGLVRRTYPSIRPRMLGFVIYSPVTAIILLGWVAVLTAGVTFIVTQTLLIIKLWEMKPNNSNVTAPPKEIKDKADGDGDWDKVGAEEREDKKNA
ncbi:hypothetical protein FSARC_9351 [Fusarium sarcochroum]|uniref:Uncharacterized protein n=1 Tax=Fusarium sarcochroum TaxID=1208366 RepID=A0A8H4TR99_9HYPO|nr:hypothetical protein FSARC_9351 [Fusarium sarcochroum]